MRELRERLERAAARLEERRDDPSTRQSERIRLGGKVEGVKLALSYIYEEKPPTEIVLPRLVGNVHYAEGLVTPDVTHFGFVSIDFGECRYVTDDFLVALLEAVAESGAFGVNVRRASPEMMDRIVTLAAGITEVIA